YWLYSSASSSFSLFFSCLCTHRDFHSFPTRRSSDLGFAALGFFLHSIPLLFVALGMFGVIAALFGPVKYAMLPDQLTVGELATGNALVEGATFMAILIGTIAGGQLVSGSSHMGWVALAVIGLALLSWGSAAQIPHTAPSAPDLAVTVNPWTSTSH